MHLTSSRLTIDNALLTVTYYLGLSRVLALDFDQWYLGSFCFLLCEAVSEDILRAKNFGHEIRTYDVKSRPPDVSILRELINLISALF